MVCSAISYHATGHHGMCDRHSHNPAVNCCWYVGMLDRTGTGASTASLAGHCMQRSAAATAMPCALLVHAQHMLRIQVLDALLQPGPGGGEEGWGGAQGRRAMLAGRGEAADAG